MRLNQTSSDLTKKNNLLDLICFYVLFRLRKVVTEEEPDVTEVSRLFRSVLCNYLDEVEEGATRERAQKTRANRSKSMSVINLRSRLRINPLWSRVTAGRHSEELPEEEDEDEDNIHRNRRIRSMPDINVVEERAPTWTRCVWNRKIFMILANSCFFLHRLFDSIACSSVIMEESFTGIMPLFFLIQAVFQAFLQHGLSWFIMNLL